MKGFVRQLHLDEYVAREKLPLRVDLAATAHFRDLLDRHQHLLEQLFEPALLGLFADRFSDLLFEVGIGVDDVPALIHRLGCGARHQWMPKTKVTKYRMI